MQLLKFSDFSRVARWWSAALNACDGHSLFEIEWRMFEICFEIGMMNIELTRQKVVRERNKNRNKWNIIPSHNERILRAQPLGFFHNSNFEISWNKQFMCAAWYPVFQSLDVQWNLSKKNPIITISSEVFLICETNIFGSSERWARYILFFSDTISYHAN